MPIYDYACTTCGHRFEAIHGIHDPGPSACPDCGAETLRKAVAPPAIHFKGSGWAKKERRAAGTLSSGGSRSESASADRSDGSGGSTTGATDGGSGGPPGGRGSGTASVAAEPD